jgi:hypothetical protein
MLRPVLDGTFDDVIAIRGYGLDDGQVSKLRTATYTMSLLLPKLSCFPTRRCCCRCLYRARFGNDGFFHIGRRNVGLIFADRLVGLDGFAIERVNQLALGRLSDRRTDREASRIGRLILGER